MICLWFLKSFADARGLGKSGPIIHIKEMADKIDNTSGAGPLYRERTPEGTVRREPVAQPVSTPKSAQNTADTPPETTPDGAANAAKKTELGGPKGLEPTRFGDWERDGRCVDF